MDQKQLRDWEAKCIQEEPPACRAGCPVNVDARAFCLAMAADDMVAARAVLEKNMPLTGILGRLCEAPCEEFCIRGPLGGSIAIGGLERVAVQSALMAGRILKLPPRPKSVLVVGGGPSSLTVAFDLAKKGYPVGLIHPPPGPGGWLWELPEARLPKEVLEEELNRLEKLGVRFHETAVLDTSVVAKSQEDAIYVGQDDHLSPDLSALLAGPDDKTFALPGAKMFTGGFSPADHRYRLVTDISQGREAAVSIDRFLQGASLTASRVPLRHGRTDLFTNTSKIAEKKRILPGDPAGFSPEEAVAEAGRCLDCQCLECVRSCVYLAEHGAYPKVYARRIYNNSAIVKGVHQANKFINSCSLCRQCETLCPKDFSMADLCLEARQQMVREKRMPGSAHWFALEEMRTASEEASLARHAPGKSASRLLFFPGCQLAGVRPDQTLRLYDHLLELEEKTGIWLNCCGAPAHWSGRNDQCTVHIDRLRESWRLMGSPKVVTACSSCLFLFRTYLPEMQAESVWLLLARETWAAGRPGPAMVLTDPCTARHDQPTRNAVRSLLQAVGQPLGPLEMIEELTECCGYGGLMENAAPATAKKVREARVSQTDCGFITYCAMCREQLARTGRPVVHLLDILFADSAVAATAPALSPSARRSGRRYLQGKLLARHSPAAAPAREPWQDIGLVITDEVAALMEQRRIVEDDIRQVLVQVEQGGSCFAHRGDDRRIASARLGEVTFWLEYQQRGGRYHIDRCWSHRMVIGGKS
jgi:Fe-S oxidoreductase